MRGEGSAVVYGCCRILSYGESRVCLARRNDRVCVWGEKLLCTSFSAGTVTVEGCITGVRYCRESCLECTEVEK